MEKNQCTAEVTERESGRRLDQALASLFPDYSRSRLQIWIKQGRVLVDGEAHKPRDKVFAGQRLSLEPVQEKRVTDQAQDIPLDLVYEDESLLIVNKPPGLVVHPAAGNPDGTLQNALLFHDPGQAALPRAGIVHRLDKDTSGLMVVAKTQLAHKYLVEAMQERMIKREYKALVRGLPTAGGTVEAPVGRHPTRRTRMAVVAGGKQAITHYRIERRYRIHTLLRVRLETGRTHQIRVHMAHIHYPLVGDPVYGGRLTIPRGADEPTRDGLRAFKRQALHACKLGLPHPLGGKFLEWEAPMPADLQHLLDLLEADFRAHA